MRNITITPVVTEKSLAEVKSNKFTFASAKSISKIEIAKFLSTEYKVDVVNVTKILQRAKSKRVGMTRKFKLVSRPVKYIVKLKPGQIIPGFDSKVD